jgi:Transcriptional regulators containing a DNA-binding HTH domain and an aminotransferase domain (MocR family) and their eukaryotic orthologs
VFSEKALKIELSPIERIMERVTSETINLAGGSPDPEVIPVQEIKHAFEEVVAEWGASAFFYPGAGGLEELRKQIRSYASYLGVAGGDVAVTSGAQHALTLLCASLLSGEAFAHENPTFVEGMNPFLFYGGLSLPIRVDQNGLVVEELEARVKSNKPKLVYTVPLCHNPTGVNMSEQRRKKLVELAEKFDFFVVEDDPYRPISEKQPTPLYNFSQERVIYVGSLSKALAPGLRIGFIITKNQELLQRVKALEQMDFSTSTSNQLLASRLLKKGVVTQRLQALREHYKQKMRILVESLKRHQIPLVFEPQGGFFALIDAKKHAEQVAHEALKKGVAVVPAKPFYFDGTGQTHLRISVGPVPKQKIDEGVWILSKVLKC